MTEARLTDDVIDGLSGRELDEAVFAALGFERINLAFFRGPHSELRGSHTIANYHSYRDAAMGLLMSLDIEECGWSITHTTDGFAVHSEMDGAPLASGPKDQAATVLCRAFLKLKNRS